MAVKDKKTIHFVLESNLLEIKVGVDLKILCNSVVLIFKPTLPMCIKLGNVVVITTLPITSSSIFTR
jgi:hypothetical protein